ncbi:type II secretion system protein N [Kangiella sp.]|uniref:type II secretion system protein N n=1 Tax=Kangiella sp. TaxID=1920245 RepID=UPI001984765F|nr:type II secretion system protein N [Kangiella sp.]MBD3654634.1 type II secretion system protein N [Kangiella sp.]
MKKLVISSTAVIVVLLIFIVSMAPARVVLPWFTQSLPQVSFSQPAGTIWNTSLDSVAYRDQTIHNISMQTSFWSLLSGSLSSDIQINDQHLFVDGSFKLNRQSVSVLNTDYELDATSVLQWVKLPITELSGHFSGKVQELELASDEVVKLAAEGLWQNAVVGYPNSVLELGDIHFTIERTENGRALLTITDNPGMLDLKGTLEVGFDKQYQLNVSTQTDVPSQIKQWLTQLGRTENNRVVIKWNGRLP